MTVILIFAAYAFWLIASLYALRLSHSRMFCGLGVLPTLVLPTTVLFTLYTGSSLKQTFAAEARLFGCVDDQITVLNTSRELVELNDNMLEETGAETREQLSSHRNALEVAQADLKECQDQVQVQLANPKFEVTTEFLALLAVILGSFQWAFGWIIKPSWRMEA